MKLLNIIRAPHLYFDGPAAVGILFLRFVFGLALMLHGQSKIANPFGWMGDKVPGFLQALAALSEFGGGLALIVGCFTGLACLGIMSTMFVAILSHLTNAKTPTYFVSPKGAPENSDSFESAALYFVVALTVFLTGPGVLSIDRLLFARKKA